MLLGAILLALLFFGPQLALVARFAGRIYADPREVPPAGYAAVLRAYVLEDGTLTDAALERTEGGVRLYREGRAARLFVSGDNRSHDQAEAMAGYARERGVAAEDVVVDPLGIDTHDTCRHFAAIAGEGVIVTQGYHLPRTMYMCESDGVEVVGLAVNRMDILSSRGSNLAAIYATRAGRFVREAGLTWLFLLGLYDRISQDAEILEGN